LRQLDMDMPGKLYEKHSLVFQHQLFKGIKK